MQSVQGVQSMQTMQLPKLGQRALAPTRPAWNLDLQPAQTACHRPQSPPLRPRCPRYCHVLNRFCPWRRPSHWHWKKASPRGGLLSSARKVLAYPTPSLPPPPSLPLSQRLCTSSCRLLLLLPFTPKHVHPAIVLNTCCLYTYVHRVLRHIDSAPSACARTDMAPEPCPGHPPPESQLGANKADRPFSTQSSSNLPLVTFPFLGDSISYLSLYPFPRSHPLPESFEPSLQLAQENLCDLSLRDSTQQSYSTHHPEEDNNTDVGCVAFETSDDPYFSHWTPSSHCSSRESSSGHCLSRLGHKPDSPPAQPDISIYKHSLPQEALMATGFGPVSSDSRRGVSSPRPKGRGMEVLLYSLLFVALIYVNRSKEYLLPQCHYLWALSLRNYLPLYT